MPVVPFFGLSSRDQDARAMATSRLVNLYPEGTTEGALTLKSVLGLRSFAATSAVFVRAMAKIGGSLWICAGGRLLQATEGGAVSDRGAVADSDITSIAGSGGNVTAVANGNYYFFDGALSNPTPGAFSDFGSVAFVGGYTVLSELNGNRFQWSAPNDPEDLPGLNFAEANGRDDAIVRVFAVGSLLYIFKETSHEVWYVTGEAGARAFERQAGGVYDLGLKSHDLNCDVPGGGVFFVGSDGRAHNVGVPQPVSTPAVETAIKDCDPRACLAWEDEGHTFLAIVMRDCPAWVYDLATGRWHERAQDYDLRAWRVNVSAKAWGNWYAGRDGGEILRFDRVNRDTTLPLVRQATGATVDFKNWQTVNQFIAYPETGDVATTISLEVSRDRGKTWSDPKTRSWAVGYYARQVAWRGLGACRQFTPRLTMSDQADVVMRAEGWLE